MIVSWNYEKDIDRVIIDMVMCAIDTCQLAAPIIAFIYTWKDNYFKRKTLRVIEKPYTTHLRNMKYDALEWTNF